MNLVHLVVLALAAAVYPTLLAGVILMLAQPRPLRMLLTFYLAGVTISLIAGFAVYAALRSSGAVSPSNSTSPVLDIVIGVGSLLLAYGMASGRITGAFIRRRRERRQAKREPSEPKPSFTERALGGGSTVMVVLAALVLNLPGIWYLDALAEMAQAKPSAGTLVLDIVLFNLIMFALVEIPVAGYLIDPDSAAARVTRLQDAARGHSKTIAVWVAAGVGVWLVIKGFVHLS